MLLVLLAITLLTSRICKAAGIKGFKTNYSLRVTTVTRLFQAGVDEQLMMERTGHHSIDGILTYKRSSAEQQEEISKILSRSKELKEDTSKGSTCISLVQPSTSLVTKDPQNMQVGSFQSGSTSQQLLFHPDNLQRNLLSIHVLVLTSMSRSSSYRRLIN